MKKIAFIVVALIMSVAAHAQFEKGKVYVGASLSGLDLSSQAKKFHFGADAKIGYLLADNLMATAMGSFDHLQDDGNTCAFGVGGRYYIVQNGLYLGGTVKYKHSRNYNDCVPGLQVGYAFFVSRTVTIEPELYFDFSTKHFDYSNYGLRIGIGVYLFKDKTQN
jgi:hypothetical protein